MSSENNNFKLFSDLFILIKNASRGKKFTVLSFSIGLLTYIFNNYSEFRPLDNFIDKSAELNWYIVSVFICVGLIIDWVVPVYEKNKILENEEIYFLINPSDKSVNTTKYEFQIDRAWKNLNEFDKNWHWVIYTWFTFYFFSTIFMLMSVFHKSFAITLNPDLKIWITRIFDIFLDLVNILNTYFILRCYVILAFKTYVNSDFRWPRNFIYIASLIIVFVLVLNIMLKFSIVGNIGEKKDLYNMIILYSSILNLVIGISSATVLGLLVGRLDSKFISPRPFLIIVLFTYVSVQVAYPLFKASLYKLQPFWNFTAETAKIASNLTITMLIVACVGKLAFASVLHRAVRNSNFLIYFLRINVFDENEEKQSPRQKLAQGLDSCKFIN